MRLPGPTHRVVGFESRAEAQRFLAEFRERLAKFGLVPEGGLLAPNRQGKSHAYGCAS